MVVFFFSTAFLPSICCFFLFSPTLFRFCLLLINSNISPIPDPVFTCRQCDLRSRSVQCATSLILVPLRVLLFPLHSSSPFQLFIYAVILPALFLRFVGQPLPQTQPLWLWSPFSWWTAAQLTNATRTLLLSHPCLPTSYLFQPISLPPASQSFLNASFYHVSSSLWSLIPIPFPTRQVSLLDGLLWIKLCSILSPFRMGLTNPGRALGRCC